MSSFDIPSMACIARPDSVGRAAARSNELHPVECRFTSPPRDAVRLADSHVMHGTEVLVYDLGALADGTRDPVFEPEDAITHRAHRAEAVGHDHDRLAGLLELGELVGAATLECLVADGQHLIHE